jgi:dTDP-4-amino-4,6-dideoxygalactose transaminase
MTMTYRIPFNKPQFVGSELEYIAESMKLGKVSGDGEFTRRCSEFLEKAVGTKKALLTTSCTHALEMAALLLNIEEGDEVIVPSFTFVSTVNAFVLRGAKPIFLDIRPDTLNMDERLLESAITERTKAIVPVHYAGVGCEMDAITAIVTKYGIACVEDNAHGLFARYKGKNLGTFGCMSTQSFHETKNIHCGEGGALLLNDETLIERAEIIREKGTNRSRFFRGQVDKYTWVDVGSSYLPSDMLAAFLFAQFEQHNRIQMARQKIWTRYHQELASWARTIGASLPAVPSHCEQPFHMFYLLMPSLEGRQALISHLKSQGILSVYHYVPLHSSEMGIKYGAEPSDCPVTTDISDRIVRLPLYMGLSEQEQDLIITAVKQFIPNSNTAVVVMPATTASLNPC